MLPLRVMGQNTEKFLITRLISFLPNSTTLNFKVKFIGLPINVTFLTMWTFIKDMHKAALMQKNAFAGKRPLFLQESSKMEVMKLNFCKKKFKLTNNSAIE